MNEAEGYLNTLNQGLVQLEQEPLNQALLGELFRAAHTLKGAARMMGFNDVQQLAHSIEDVLSHLKMGKTDFNASTADSVFHLLDEITQHMQKIRAEASEAAEPAAAGTAIQPQVSDGDETIRVPLSKINRFLNLIGEIIINKVRTSYRIHSFKKLTHEARHLDQSFVELENAVKTGAPLEPILAKFQEGRAYSRELKGGLARLFDELQEEIFYLSPVIEELQQRMKEIRMLPCAAIFEGFPRLVRDLAREQNKEVQLVIKGMETEIDKKVLEAIKGPLIHLLKNAVDHGIELPEEREKFGKPRGGIVHLNAFHQGGKVIIEIQDDGRGIDIAYLKQCALDRQLFTPGQINLMTDDEIFDLIFQEGFSTAPIITDVSGRGIGLDVVKKELLQLKGEVHIVSKPGVGTTVRLELPLTIAVAQALLVETCGKHFAIPIDQLESSLHLDAEEIASLHNRKVIQAKGKSLAAFSLAALMGLNQDHPEFEKAAIIVQMQNKQVALLVESVVGEQEVFIKNLGSYLGKIPSLGGAAILANGEVVIILDVFGICQQLAQSLQTKGSTLQPVNKVEQKRKKILLVEDSLATRELEKTILENHGYEIETAMDGLEALDKLSRGTFDAIVSDIQMPRMDGIEFCRNVRTTERWREIPLIFVTSLAKEEERRRGIEVGADAYLTKGEFDQNHLLETLSRLT